MSETYVPERNDIVCFDFDARENIIGDFQYALVLSSQLYNEKTRLLICCPISSSIRGASIEVDVNNLPQPSVASANLIHTLEWKNNNAKKVTVGESGLIDEVLLRLIPLIGADRVIKDFISNNRS